MTERVPVLVVGGGLTGLSAALFLGWQGCRSLVVERHPATSTHPKARGFNARTMELFRSAGIADTVLSASADLRDNHDIVLCHTLAEGPFKRVDKSRNDPETSRVSPAQECLCPQDVLEPILVEAGRGNGADIRFGSVLEGFEQDEHGVTATIDGRPVRADYLIACDGAQSPIRRSLGIETTEESETFHSVGISFRADLTELVTDPFILAYITHPDSRGVLLPINNRDRWVFHVRVDPARGEKAADFTRERCEHLIRVATGRSDLDIELTSVAEWATNSSLARGYRTGRVFLAGDAAHAVPPAGALGANTSIQDVHNLAWKLAFVLNGLAGDALLDTYEVERRPVGRMTGDQALIRWHNSEQNSAGTGFVNDVGVMFGVQYVSSAVRNTTLLPPFTVAVDGTPGTRVPHVWLAAGKTTLDLVGPGFTLLHRDEHWARAVAELPIPVRSCRVDWPHADALLVRPDGYVAWRGDDPSALPAAVRDVVAGASVMPGVAP